MAKVREVGAVLRARFGGLAANLIASANGSAVALVDAVTANFPGGVQPHDCSEVVLVALWRLLLTRCAVGVCPEERAVYQRSNAQWCCAWDFTLVAGFRDHSVYDGRQVFFYKRAQVRCTCAIAARCEPFRPALRPGVGELGEVARVFVSCMCLCLPDCGRGCVGCVRVSTLAWATSRGRYSSSIGRLLRHRRLDHVRYAPIRVAISAVPPSFPRICC